MRRNIAILLAASAVLWAGAAAPPPLPITDLKQLPVVTTAPYDEKADADKLVDAAFARAKKSHKLVMLDLGAIGAPIASSWPMSCACRR